MCPLLQPILVTNSLIEPFISSLRGDHIVILGYERSAIWMIQELCCAMETSGGGLIAILSTEGKAEVESWIQHADIDLRPCG